LSPKTPPTQENREHGTSKEPPPPELSGAGPGTVERAVQLYGDLVFDLCESVLWSPITAQIAFRSILKTIRKKHRGHGFTEHERAWVLQIACDKLREATEQHGRKLTSSEQIQLDSAQNVASRLKQFDAYFHRLTTEDQVLMLLRDKYGIPYPEIAAALGIPEGTLKIRRAQALRSLEEWLWDPR
jgi:DNA-directed RNA polymerase specialized sigma24 family protein